MMYKTSPLFNRMDREDKVIIDFLDCVKGNLNADCYIYLCNRANASSYEISFDKYDSNWSYLCSVSKTYCASRVEGKFSEEPSCMQSKEKNRFEKIKKCYLIGEISNSPHSVYIAPIPSRIGCLGVVLFELKKTTKGHGGASPRRNILYIIFHVNAWAGYTFEYKSF